jgi:hypothetical protein
MMMMLQENCNTQVGSDYSEATKRALAMMSEKELSFELVEVRFVQISYRHCHYLKLN